MSFPSLKDQQPPLVCTNRQKKTTDCWKALNNLNIILLKLKNMYITILLKTEFCICFRNSDAD